MDHSATFQSTAHTSFTFLRLPMRIRVYPRDCVQSIIQGDCSELFLAPRYKQGLCSSVLAGPVPSAVARFPPVLQQNWAAHSEEPSWQQTCLPRQWSHLLPTGEHLAAKGRDTGHPRGKREKGFGQSWILYL